MPRFPNMSSTERRQAQAVLNNYNRFLDRLENESLKLKNIDYLKGRISFRQYLGYTEDSLSVFTDFTSFDTSVKARTAEIKYRIKEQKERYRTMRRKPANEIPDGGYVYLSIAYRNGNGAFFIGYLDEEAPEPDLAEITHWL